MNEIRAQRRQRMFKAIQEKNELFRKENDQKILSDDEISDEMSQEESDYYSTDFNEEYGKFS